MFFDDANLISGSKLYHS